MNIGIVGVSLSYQNNNNMEVSEKLYNQMETVQENINLSDEEKLKRLKEAKGGIFQDASDYIAINKAQFRLVAERRIVIIIEKEIYSYIRELKNKVNVL